MPRSVEEIAVAVTAGRPTALGQVWRITARKTDFYLQPYGDAHGIHLSMHGPKERFPDGHPFHVKVDPAAMVATSMGGSLAIHAIPRKGYAFDGEQLTSHAYLVARVRWSWDIVRPRFEQVTATVLPSIQERGGHGFVMRKPVGDNEAVDLDIVVSYGMPYWRGGEKSASDNARLGPLVNDADMWMTGTVYRRWQSAEPTPPGLAVPRPTSRDAPRRITGGGPGAHGSSGIYWFVQGVTSEAVLERSRLAWLEERD